jgi:hypothetical protein
VYAAIECPALAELHRQIGLSLPCLPHEHGSYIPHATISYVQPGTGPALAKRLDQLAGIAGYFDELVLSDRMGERQTFRFGEPAALHEALRPAPRSLPSTARTLAADRAPIAASLAGDAGLDALWSAALAASAAEAAAEPAST